MNRCLKCGRSAGEDQVFCEACLKDMERYPVKPGTPVVLPVRPAREAERRPEKRKVPPAVEIARLRRQRQSLWIAVAALAAALCLCVGLLLFRWLNPGTPEETLPPGRDYITDATPAPQEIVSRETSRSTG